jgi:hypothetical protein
MADLNVVATKPGIFANCQKAAGAKFRLETVGQFSHNWMKAIGWTAPTKSAPPAPARRTFAKGIPSGRLHPSVKAKAAEKEPLVVIDHDRPRATSKPKPKTKPKPKKK